MHAAAAHSCPHLRSQLRAGLGPPAAIGPMPTDSASLGQASMQSAVRTTRTFVILPSVKAVRARAIAVGASVACTVPTLT